MTYAVESRVPETAQEYVVSPEPGGSYGGRLAQNNGTDSAEDEDAEADTSANPGVDDMAQETADDVGEDVSNIVQAEPDPANLINRVPPAIQAGGEKDLAPDGEEQGEVVDEHVDGIQGVEPILTAVNQGDQGAAAEDGEGNNPVWDALAPVSVADEGDQHLAEGKDASDSKKEQSEEEEGREEVGAGHLGKGFGVGEESRAECGQSGFARGHAQISNDAHDGQSGDDLNGGVAEGDDEGVLDGVGELVVVRRVGGEVTETDTNGEEHLAEGVLPDCWSLERL